MKCNESNYSPSYVNNLEKHGIVALIHPLKDPLLMSSVKYTTEGCHLQ